MREVFISYARDDRDHAAALAGALEGTGVSVWWDRQIPPGRTFDDVIEDALTAAHCVLVLWSQNSTESRWVRAEASAAADRGVLIPILVEPVEPPLEFRNIQAADLSGWSGDIDDPELQKLFATVSAMVGKPAANPARPTRRAAAWKTPPAFQKLAIALVSLVAGAGLAYVLLSSQPSDDDRRPTATGVDDAAVSRAPAAGGRSSSPAAVTPVERGDAASASDRIDLLAAANGGHLVRAPHENWMQPIDGSENWDYITGSEAVYAFRDEKPATFDTFAMLITETRGWNIKTFELQAASASATGPFQSLGTFETQNVRLFPSPWQQFTFAPVRARYLKVKILALHQPSGATQIEQWQLLGTF